MNTSPPPSDEELLKLAEKVFAWHQPHTPEAKCARALRARITEGPTRNALIAELKAQHKKGVSYEELADAILSLWATPRGAPEPVGLTEETIYKILGQHFALSGEKIGFARGCAKDIADRLKSAAPSLPALTDEDQKLVANARFYIAHGNAGNGHAANLLAIIDRAYPGQKKDGE